MSSLDTPAGRIAFSDNGRGPTLLLVHVDMSSYLWRDLQRELTPHFRRVTLDAPGNGHSSRPGKAGTTLTSAAVAVGAVIDQLDLRDITLVLHDLGGPAGVADALCADTLFDTAEHALRGPPADHRVRSVQRPAEAPAALAGTVSRSPSAHRPSRQPLPDVRRTRRRGDLAERLARGERPHRIVGVPAENDGRWCITKDSHQISAARAGLVLMSRPVLLRHPARVPALVIDAAHEFGLLRGEMRTGFHRQPVAQRVQPRTQHPVGEAPIVGGELLGHVAHPRVRGLHAEEEMSVVDDA